MLETLTFDLATAVDGRVTAVREGLFPPGTPDWMYLPVAVPEGVRRLSVSYDYDRTETPEGVPGNALDLAVFDPAGFRGYSGGARAGFTIEATAATPGYAPGPVAEGEWRILLAPYTIAPRGLAYRVEVTLELADDAGAESGRVATERAFEPAFAPTRARGRGRGWYRGDMHLHSVHSDGQRSPREIVDEVRAAGLDFMVSTEHNTNTAHAVWGRFVSGPDDDLLILAGEEVTTRNGHLVAAGLDPGTWLDWRFRSRDAGALAALTERLRAAGGIAIAAHPHAPCLGCQWKYGYEHVDAVEVWNGSWTPDDEVSLQQWNSMLVSADSGRWVPAVGDSDSHTTADPIGLPQTVVLADDLSREAILDGVRAGRCYVAESADIAVTFAASGDGRSAGIGERLEVSDDTTVEVELTVNGVSDGLVRLVTDEGWMLETPLPASGTVTWSTTPAVSSYVRAEIRRPGPRYFEPMAAFTNPIFLGGRACTSA